MCVSLDVSPCQAHTYKVYNLMSVHVCLSPWEVLLEAGLRDGRAQVVQRDHLLVVQTHLHKNKIIIPSVSIKSCKFPLHAPTCDQ
jgi:hypothetical protein